MSKFVERGYVDNSDRCETVTVNGVVYNKGSEPSVVVVKESVKSETPGTGVNTDLVVKPKRGRKKKAE